MQTRKPIVGSIIYSKDAIISKGGTNLGRLFAVNSIDDAGNMQLWALTSALSTTEAAVEVTPDKINWLRKPAHLLVNIEVQMSALWDYVQQPGTLDSAIMTAAAQCIERYKKEDKTLITVQAGEPIEIDSRDVRDKINDLYANFKKDPTDYLEYLQFSARFYQYSARNAALIYMQNPHSTFVTSRHRWLQLGYSIKQSDNRRSLEIFKPVTQKYINRNGTLIPLRDATRNEKMLIASKAIPLIEKQYYAKMPVWDISQTNCPPSDYPRVYDMGHSSVPHKQLFDAVKQVAELEGIVVATEDLRSISLSGYYNPNDNTIHLNQAENDTKAAITLCHEYAHALMHNTSDLKTPVEVKEFEAESLALVLASSYGLPEDELDAGYMAQYLNKVKADVNFSMEASVQRISKAMHHIEARITLNLLQETPAQEFTMEAQIKQNFLQDLERM